MHAYFRRFRALRGKGVGGIAHDSLQRSWCAMIVRWNRMLRADTSFVEWLEACEEVVGNYSLRDLRRACVPTCGMLVESATSKCEKATPSV
uniref:Uncharacterized protein n=1 Tax=Phytophthora fragariae TaxID=53985 RepID=A0A6A3DFW7_9STRA|nr:hypothetical protein PF009_g29434 [Phytophthora fragariae]